VVLFRAGVLLPLLLVFMPALLLLGVLALLLLKLLVELKDPEP
jgi:hypothetical protein